MVFFNKTYMSVSGLLIMKTKTIAKGKCFGSPARQRDSLAFLYWPCCFHQLFLIVVVIFASLSGKILKSRVNLFIINNRLLFDNQIKLQVQCGRPQGAWSDLYHVRGLLTWGHWRPLTDTIVPQHHGTDAQLMHIILPTWTK